jgi:anti-anti-sigma factor
MRLADLRHELRDSILYTALTGEVDMSNAEELREGLIAMIPNDALGVILDLSDVEYLDSAGIHLMFRLRDSLRTRGQRLALVIPPHSAVNDTLRLAGIARGSEMLQTPDAARQALTAANPLSSEGV